MPGNPHGGQGQTGQLDFSVSTNPYGPPPELVDVCASADIARYPAADDGDLRQVLARLHAVEPDAIVVGAGTSELIYRLSAAALRKGDAVAIASPTFNEFARAAAVRGAKVVSVRCYDDVVPDASRLLEAIAQHRPRLVWLCSPNNPTGHRWPEDTLAEIASACAEREALFCLDAAYGFVETAWLGRLRGGAFQLHSPTKTFGIPGVRLGYALAPVDLARALRDLAPPWLLGASALAAGLWLCGNAALDFARQTGPRHANDARALAAALAAVGLRPRPSQAGFFLLDTDHADDIRAGALAQGMVLRGCADFGLPTCLRIAARRPEANATLMDWLTTAAKSSGRSFPSR